MVNTQLLLKAMRFMLLPTLAVLSVVFFWFFNIHDFLSFITSQSFFASFLRIIIMILEIFCVYTMYGYYEDEEKKKTGKDLINNPAALMQEHSSVGVTGSTSVRDLLNGDYSDNYKVWNTEDFNLKIIQRIPKKS